jgi:hypothetical protein
MEKNWRLESVAHLASQPLRRKKWTRWSREWDHNHCEYCGAKFAEFEGEDILKEGFASTEAHPRGENYHWVCINCFADLKDLIGWYAVE